MQQNLGAVKWNYYPVLPVNVQSQATNAMTGNLGFFRLIPAN